MVIARMPEDRSKTFENLPKLTKTFKAIYTCMCTPVGPTDRVLPYPKARCWSVRVQRPRDWARAHFGPLSR
eukprot:15555290-Heterocapsa_arctica.AAC.1